MDPTPALRVLALLLPLLGCLGPPRQTFDMSPIGTEPLRIAAGAEADEDPAIVRTRDGGYRVVWWSKRNGQVDLFTSRSNDGVTWEDEHAITNDGVEDFYPSLAESHDGTLHLAWFRFERRLRRKDIWYARSENGRDWTRPVRISKAGADWAPAIYEDRDDMLWIVWSSGRTGNRELYAARSGDGGRTWSRDFRLTQSPEEDDFPSVLVTASGERLLAWTRYRPGSNVEDYYRDPSSEIVTATSKDGLHWSAPVTWSPPDPNARYMDFLPHLFADAERRHTYLAWTSSRAGRRGDVLVRELSPSSPIHQLTASPNSDYGGRIVPTGQRGEYLMVWTSGREGHMHVFARRFLL